MIERFLLRVKNWLGRVIGPNWRTSISGILAVTAGFVLTTPEAISFLPDVFVSWLELFSKIVIVIGGGAFAMYAKDKDVTGGSLPCTDEAKRRVGL